MDYSQLGSMWEIPTQDICQLLDLNENEYFIHWNHRNRKSPLKYKVWGKCEFNAEYGSATRKCVQVSDGSFHNKSCKLTVIKIS